MQIRTYIELGVFTTNVKNRRKFIFYLIIKFGLENIFFNNALEINLTWTRGDLVLCGLTRPAALRGSHSGLLLTREEGRQEGECFIISFDEIQIGCWGMKPS